MNAQTIILMGPSGSGKGTQARKISEHLKKVDPTRDLLFLQSGQRLRDLAEQKSYVGSMVKNTIEEGLLVPEFLTVWAWGNTLVKDYSGDQHIISDGTPRKLLEATVLSEAFTYLQRENVTVIILSVSKRVSRERLNKRGRSDDLSEDDVKRRLNWYDTEVQPVISFLKERSNYIVAEINGDLDEESVFKEILLKTGL